MTDQTKIIELRIDEPKSDETWVRQAMGRMLLDAGLETLDPGIRQCVKQRMEEKLSKYRGIPTLKAIGIDASSIDPVALESTKKILAALASDYLAKISSLKGDLLAEIFALQLKVCQYEHGRPSP
jgi:hypothetical protein